MRSARGAIIPCAMRVKKGKDLLETDSCRKTDYHLACRCKVIIRHIIKFESLKGQYIDDRRTPVRRIRKRCVVSILIVLNTAQSARRQFKETTRASSPPPIAHHESLTILGRPNLGLSSNWPNNRPTEQRYGMDYNR